MVGWKKGEGMLIGEKIPDTTPTANLARQEEEIKKVAADSAVKEATAKK